jgi:hypothetical protein
MMKKEERGREYGDDYIKLNLFIYILSNSDEYSRI